jgi:hypothetical protein
LPDLYAAENLNGWQQQQQQQQQDSKFQWQQQQQWSDGLDDVRGTMI